MDDALRAKEDAVFRKISRRLIWFLFLLLAVNFLDRTNIGMAALTMNKALGLSASVFGVAIAAFTFAYLLCEIPSNIALERFGARIWIARIMVTWGIAAAACCLVNGPVSLIILRMLVGLAEGGFMTGIILYLTYWYPQFRRARAQANYMIAQPVVGVVGSIVSSLLLGMDGTLGMAGWRWLFLIEGLPAIVLGVVAYFYLTDRPATSSWLTPEEREIASAAVRRDAEAREAASEVSGSVWRMILSRNMLLISFADMMMVINLSSIAYWLPQIVRALSSEGTPYWVTGLISALPPLASMITLPLWSAKSDRAGERYWHAIIPMIASGLGWFIAAGATDPFVQIAGLTIGNACAAAVWSIFFTMPSALLPRHAHAVSIAFLNTVGIGGAMLGPLIIGYLRDLTGSFTAPMIFVGATIIFGAGLLALVPRRLLCRNTSDDVPEAAVMASRRDVAS